MFEQETVKNTETHTQVHTLPDYVTPVEKCPALVLNADFRPLSYYPLSLWSWQDSLKAAFQQRVNVVAEYERVVRSPGLEMRLPSVIALKDFVPTAKRTAFTRFNVFLRDSFCCQYCGVKHKSQDLTFDHVVPRALKGKTNWTNVVTACQKCNRTKGSKLLVDVGFKLLQKPTELDD
ncbi:MAG: HNH endonuclease [Alphaproteobacteria bacterium]